MMNSIKLINYLVADTAAFIQNTQLQNVANNIFTCPDVVNEINNKRQLRRLAVLPYALIVKEPFPENIKLVTDFSKKTGDYRSLSATDIKVLALTYQLEKEKVGTEHLRTKPIVEKAEITTENKLDTNPDVTGFFLPTDSEEIGIENNESDKIRDENDTENILVPVKEDDDTSGGESDDGEDDDDSDSGWITPSNVKIVKQQVNSDLLEQKKVEVACMTTDFAMQNVLLQMNLNVSALDGRLIKQLRTYILRCYACFKTTSIMTKKFCPKCGNDTLKKVGVSLDEHGKMQIHINIKRPLTAKGKRFSLPRIKGGKHPNNPILVEDQPMPDNKPTRLARTKNNPLDDDYTAGFSPFVMRDINSKSAQLCIRPGQEIKHWMRKNPNESRRRRK
ncbi:RNA-binding protein NOB1 [Diorhabda sublineata]|uniref:RNA-binding protein NOB1 n=1 Tax=Diorhabda sublineata TaxID=1163346 RepID=UPI0024E0F10B|nr:RNA-binding protein NOB1 [Diorhabda sublineata]